MSLKAECTLIILIIRREEEKRNKDQITFEEGDNL